MIGGYLPRGFDRTDRNARISHPTGPTGGWEEVRPPPRRGEGGSERRDTMPGTPGEKREPENSLMMVTTREEYCFLWDPDCLPELVESLLGYGETPDDEAELAAFPAMEVEAEIDTQGAPVVGAAMASRRCVASARSMPSSRVRRRQVARASR